MASAEADVVEIEGVSRGSVHQRGQRGGEPDPAAEHGRGPRSGLRAGVVERESAWFFVRGGDDHPAQVEHCLLDDLYGTR